MPNTHFSNTVLLGTTQPGGSPSVAARLIELLIAATSATAATLTYTAAQVLGGIFLRTQTGTSTDTLPTATLLRDALVLATAGGNPLGGVLQVGAAVRLHIRNGGTGTITVAAGTGGTLSGTATIVSNSSKDFLIVFTATGANPTYTAYSLGTYVF